MLVTAVGVPPLAETWKMASRGEGAKRNGRPEGVDATVSAGDDAVCAGAERMQVKFATGAKDERSAVGRERGLLSEIAFDFE
jgi:hypothetical protein